LCRELTFRFRRRHSRHLRLPEAPYGLLARPCLPLRHQSVVKRHRYTVSRCLLLWGFDDLDLERSSWHHRRREKMSKALILCHEFLIVIARIWRTRLCTLYISAVFRCRNTPGNKFPFKLNSDCRHIPLFFFVFQYSSVAESKAGWRGRESIFNNSMMCVLMKLGGRLENGH
jgi:hypothetical protein